jgi:hypothetical protein
LRYAWDSSVRLPGMTMSACRALQRRSFLKLLADLQKSYLFIPARRGSQAL